MKHTKSEKQKRKNVREEEKQRHTKRRITNMTGQRRRITERSGESSSTCPNTALTHCSRDSDAHHRKMMQGLLLLGVLATAVDAFHVMNPYGGLIDLQSNALRTTRRPRRRGLAVLYQQPITKEEASTDNSSSRRPYNLGLVPYIEDRERKSKKEKESTKEEEDEHGSEQQRNATFISENVTLVEDTNTQEENGTFQEEISKLVNASFDVNSTTTSDESSNVTSSSNSTKSKSSKKPRPYNSNNPTDFFKTYHFPFPYSTSPSSSTSSSSSSSTTTNATTTKSSTGPQSSSTASSSDKNKTKSTESSSSDTTTSSSSPSIAAPSYNSFLESLSSSFQSTNEILSANINNLQSKAMTNPSTWSSTSNTNKKSSVQLDDDPLLNLKPTDTITVADLERVLRANGYLRQADLQLQQKSAKSFASDVEDYVLFGDGRDSKVRRDYNVGSAGASSSGAVAKSSDGVSRTGQTSTSGRGSGAVAFPQPSILRYKDLQRGTMVAGGCYGLIFGATILPNLWLVGMVLGGVYGYGLQPPDSAAEVGNNPIRKLFVSTGRKFAKWYLQLYDYFQTFWFLYKTGQLSYEYWKRYAELDERFKIQDKMDAWNARFQEGKLKFDKWEKENEIGRTVLAGLRTAWLVEERRNKKRRLESKYRIIQSFYDLLYWIRSRMKRVRLGLKDLIVGVDDSSDVTSIGGAIREFVIGVVRPEAVETSSLKNGDEARLRRRKRNARIGAIIGSLIALNIFHSLFAIVSPTILTVSAVVVGIIWPTWITELFSRMQQVGEEIRARGRGEKLSSSIASRANTAKSWLGLNNRNNDYFVRWDGTRGYYKNVKRKPSTTSSWFNMPWNKEKSTNKSRYSWSNNRQQQVRRPKRKRFG